MSEINPILFNRVDWPKYFPKVILNTPLGKAAEHPDYMAAKSGDLKAAIRLTTDLINKEAYAIAVGLEFDLPIEFNIVQAARVSRTGSSGFTRLAFPPPFAGTPSNNEATYAIIFDDTLTQGGTLANLRGYVAQFDIETIAATTLTGKNYSSVLAITDETLKLLRDKYNELEKWWISAFGYGFTKLTESEAKYILNTKKNADEIRDRILAEKQEGFDGKNDSYIQI